MKFRWIGTKEVTEITIFRLFKIIWKVGKGAGNGHPDNYHAVLSISLSNKLWYKRMRTDRKVITLLGVRVVYKREYGGIPV